MEVHCGSRDMSVGILMTDSNDLKAEFEKSKYITGQKYRYLVQCSFWEDVAWNQGNLYRKSLVYGPGNNFGNKIELNGKMHHVLTLKEPNGTKHFIHMCHATGSIDNYGVFVFEVVNGKWRMRLVTDYEWTFFLKYVNRYISASKLLEVFGMCMKHANSLRRDSTKAEFPVDLEREDKAIDTFIAKLAEELEKRIDSAVWDNFKAVGLNKRVVMDSLVFWFAWIYMACISEESKRVGNGPTHIGGCVKLVCGIETLAIFKDWSVFDLCNHYNGKKSMMGEYPADTYINAEDGIVLNIKNRCYMYGFSRSDDMLALAAHEMHRAMITNMFAMQV